MDKPQILEIGPCWAIDIPDCPKELLLQVAAWGRGTVTVENLLHWGRDLPLSLHLGHEGLRPGLLRYSLDLELPHADFLRWLPELEGGGLYAVWHDRAPLKVKATDLDGPARYRALRNFGWTLELSIAAPASDGVSRIAAPDRALIERVAALLEDEAAYL
ncbi:MAG: hypothetical protein EOO11_16660 [Chitinophagaceae bacterium]|nr:MAG: hypothetical protein EOO11_16660 [Chitinophagaceae bacterium]